MGWGDPPQAGMPANADAALLDPVDDVRQNPGLDGTIESLAKVHQGHGSTRAPAFQSRVHAAVARSDDDDLLMPVGVTLHEIVGDVGEILSRNVQEIRVVVISGREHHGLGEVAFSIVPPLHLDPKPARCRRTGQRLGVDHVLTRPNVEVVMLCYPPVIDQAVPSVGLLITGDERDSPDLDPLGGGEERHAERVALDRGYDRPPVEKYAGASRLLRGHADGKPARPGPDDKQLDRFNVHRYPLRFVLLLASPLPTSPLPPPFKPR